MTPKSKLVLLILLHVHFSTFVAFANRVEELRSHLPDDFYDEVEDEYEDDRGGGGGGNAGYLDLFNEAFANKRLGINATSPRFSCHSCESPDCSHETICHNAISCYSSHIRNTDGVEEKSKGCMVKASNALLYCRAKSYNGQKIHEENGKSGQYALKCCKSELCNNGTDWPQLPDVPKVETDDDDSLNDIDSPQIFLAVAIPIVAFFILVIIISVIMRRLHRKRMEKLAASSDLERDAPIDELVGLRAQVVGDSTLREFHNDDNMTSGSGSGMPHLVSRTLSRMIEKEERIGKGRYGEVWKGRWNGDSVAIKIFCTRDEVSFNRETEIYTTVLLRHENILGYIGSDCTSHNSCTQLWLVTHFYANGSLFDYLNQQVGGLTTHQSYVILFSSLSGLLHLHTEIFGKQGKPAIAHRDIKSKNILVRDDGSCVIADFGLAVMQEKDGRLDEQHNSRVGTKRYMSPEVLDQSIDRQKDIEAYRRVDIYAFALVMWEVLRRTRVCDDDPDSAEAYALPFHNDVGPDPSFEEMKKVVCIDNRRPEILKSWSDNKFILAVSKLMKECWHKRADARLTALRIKKNLKELDPEDHRSRTKTTTDYTKNYKLNGISET